MSTWGLDIKSICKSRKWKGVCHPSQGFNEMTFDLGPQGRVEDFHWEEGDVGENTKTKKLPVQSIEEEMVSKGPGVALCILPVGPQTWQTGVTGSQEEQEIPLPWQWAPSLWRRGSDSWKTISTREKAMSLSLGGVPGTLWQWSHDSLSG